MSMETFETTPLGSGKPTVPMYYLVAVCEMDGENRPIGTHHVSMTQADSVHDAKEWAINDTACDWGYGDEQRDNLHVLFVISAPVGTEITVDEYDEGALE